MKTYFLALILFGFFTVDASSHPYGGDETLSHSDSLEREKSVFDEEIDERGVSNFYAHYSHARSQSPSSFVSPHTAIDIGTGKESSEDKEVSGSYKSSLQSYPIINPSAYFDRGEYLKAHVKEMIEKEKRYKCAERICRWCNVSWLGVGGVSTASSLIISAVGATEYVNPQLANVLCVIFGVVSGGSLWAANQSKKASREYHEEVAILQKSLGVPDRWLESEVDLRLEPYKPDAIHSNDVSPAR